MSAKIELHESKRLRLDAANGAAVAPELVSAKSKNETIKDEALAARTNKLGSDQMTPEYYILVDARRVFVANDALLAQYTGFASTQPEVPAQIRNKLQIRGLTAVSAAAAQALFAEVMANADSWKIEHAAITGDMLIVVAPDTPAADKLFLQLDANPAILSWKVSRAPPQLVHPALVTIHQTGLHQLGGTRGVITAAPPSIIGKSDARDPKHVEHVKEALEKKVKFAELYKFEA